jgi:fructuronate reductase
VAHLRGAGTPVVDVRADEIVPLAAGPVPDAVRRVVTYLDPVLGADADVISAVLEAAEQLSQQSRT